MHYAIKVTQATNVVQKIFVLSGYTSMEHTTINFIPINGRFTVRRLNWLSHEIRNFNMSVLFGKMSLRSTNVTLIQTIVLLYDFKRKSCIDEEIDTIISGYLQLWWADSL